MITEERKEFLDFLMDTNLTNQEILEVSSMIPTDEKAVRTLKILQAYQSMGKTVTRESALLATIT